MSKKDKAGKKGAGEGTVATPGPRPGYVWLVLGVILAVSVGLGTAAVVEFRASPYANFPIIDEASYVNWAREIAGGEVLGKEVFYQDPLFPYLLAAVFRVAGENFLLVRLLQVLMGAASVGLVYVLGAKIGGARAGLAGAGLMALYRGLYFFELQVLKESLAVLLVAGSCVLGAWVVEAPDRWRRFLVLGVSLGLLGLVRGNVLPLVPLLAGAAVMFERRGRWRVRLGRGGALLVGSALVLAPVAGRNYAVGGRFVLTTSQGGANFYIGNNEHADGRYALLPFVYPNPEYEARDFQAEAERRAGHALTPAEVSRFWFREGLRWIAANPGRAVKLDLHKAHLLMHQFEVGDNYNFYFLREVFVPALWAPFVGFGVLWALGLVGGWVYRREARAWYSGLFIGLYALSIIPFFIVDRYRLVLVPATAALAGCGLVWLVDQARRKAWTGLAAGLGVAGAALALSLVPTNETRQSRAQDEEELALVYFQQGDLDQAWAWYQRAAADLPPNAAARVRDWIEKGLADTEEMRGLMSRAEQEPDPERLVEVARGVLAERAQPRLAIRLYEMALRLDPDCFSAHFDLGRLYLRDAVVRDRGLARAHLQRARELRPGDPEVERELNNSVHP